MLTLFEAINVRWHATDLATAFTTVSAGEVDPLATRPYATVVPSTQAKTTRSNRGSYTADRFEVRVVADDWEATAHLAKLVQTRLLEAPLDLGPDPNGLFPERLVHLEEGSVTFQEEDQYWRAIVEFVATVGKPPWHS